MPIVRVLALLLVTLLPIAVEVAVASEPELLRQSRPEAEDRLIDSLRAADLPSVTPEEAALIAGRFVAETAAMSRPEWLNAMIGTPTLFVTSAHRPILYEFPVQVPGMALGSVFIGATEGFSSVTAYTTEGASVAAILRENLAARTGLAMGASGTETYYYGGIGRFGITAHGGTDSALRDDAGKAVVVFAPDFEPRSWIEWRAHFAADIRVSRAFVDAERELRTSYLKEGGRPVGGRVQTNIIPRMRVEANRAVGGGIGAFAHYYQENRQWSNGKCYAGCATVAAAILLQYWDRNGYPGLISSPTDNDNWSVTDGDVRWTIDQLRMKMGTTCNGTSGSTSVPSIGPGLQSYISSRGAKLTASNTNSDMWSRVKEEINAGRPTMLSFRLASKDGHGAVIYEYTDNWFSNNDWICVANGWTGQPWNCYNVTSPSEPWYAITRVRQ